MSRADAIGFVFQPRLPGFETLPRGNPVGAAPLQQRLRSAQARLTFLIFGFTFLYLAVAVRLLDASVLTKPTEPRFAMAAGTHDAIGSRADFVDRNGQLLATSLPTTSVYADPTRVMEPEAAAAGLTRALPGLDRQKLLADLTRAKSNFVWIKRHLTPTQVQAVNALGLPGVFFQKEEVRVYPAGESFGPALGYVDVDNAGIAGLEKSLDADARRGVPIALSLDARVQHLLARELGTAIEKFRAIGGAGLVMDIHTGEILALVSLPDFDANRPGTARENEKFNRVTLGVYEQGSTFKLFTVAQALEEGRTTLSEKINAVDPITMGRFTIHDFKPENRALTVPEVFLYSSNIGTARLAQRIGAERQKAFLGSLGLLSPLPFDLPEMGRPLTPNPWGDLTVMTVGYGHGIAVSPLQITTAYATLLNDGYRVTPTLRKREAPPARTGTPVISAHTAEVLRGLLRLVVSDGTAKAAEAKGYYVGGKTGTAEKEVGGRYQSDARLSSFIGAFPMQAPRYVIYAVLDEPKPAADTHGYATGGWTAAPVVGRVIAQMAPLLGLAPQLNPEGPEAAGIAKLEDYERYVTKVTDAASGTDH